MKCIVILLSILLPFFSYSNEFKLICEINNGLNNKSLDHRFSKIVDPEKKTVENISGNFFDKIIVFTDREIVMHNSVFNTSSFFNIKRNQWTSFNENYIDTYKCEKKKALESAFFLKLGRKYN